MRQKTKGRLRDPASPLPLESGRGETPHNLNQAFVSLSLSLSLSLSHPRRRLAALEGLLVQPHGRGEAAPHAVRDVRQGVAHRPEHGRLAQVARRVGPRRQVRLGRRVVVLLVVLGAGCRSGGAGGRAGGLVGGGGPLIGLVGEGGRSQSQDDRQNL